MILFQAPLDFAHRRARTVLIALVHDNDIREIEHDDFLELQTRAVIRIHHQHGLIDELALERHRFLSGPDRLDDDVIKVTLREKPQAILRRRRQAARLAARGHAAHEDAIVLGVDHRGPIPEQGAFAHHARVVRENRDPRFRVAMEKAQNDLIDERGLARAARSRKTNHARTSAFAFSVFVSAFDVRRSALLFPFA